MRTKGYEAPNVMVKFDSREITNAACDMEIDRYPWQLVTKIEED